MVLVRIKPASISVWLSPLLLAVSALTATAQAPAPAGGAAADTFKTNCAICHATDGAGSDFGKRFGAPDLRTREIQDKPAAVLAQSISAGKNKMPAFGSRLDEQQIQKLVEYVKTLHADPPPASK